MIVVYVLVMILLVMDMQVIIMKINVKEEIIAVMAIKMVRIMFENYSGIQGKIVENVVV